MLRAEKEQWLVDLRSGKYKQGTRKLHDTTEDTWCCLGVRCDRAIPASERYYDSVLNCESFQGRTATLPFSLRRFATDHSGTIIGLSDRDNSDVSLAQLNDSKEFSFAQIADVIEYFFDVED